MKQPPVANPVANTVDSISHANFRSNFQTDRTEVERKQMRQLQDRGTHNYRQQRDPDMETDLQSNLQDSQLNLQVDLQKDLQANLQMDLQADLQVRMDLQPDLWVQTELGATQISSSVSFPLQAETSTWEELVSKAPTM